MGAFVRNDDHRGRIEEMFQLFPDLAQRPGQRGGEPFGGTKADAGYCPGVDAGPGFAPVGRTFAGLSPAMMDNVLSGFER